MKNFKLLSLLLVFSILLGLGGTISPAHVEAQKPPTRMTVFELRTSPT